MEPGPLLELFGDVSAAITEAHIDGVLHEYTSIDGVHEDVVEVLLNLKQVALKLHDRDSAEIRLRKRGPGPVTAGDLEHDHSVEVVNKDWVIATLTKPTELSMTLKVERGRGYRPATAPVFEEQTRPIGSLRLDASFSPMRRVTYAVDATRVGQRTDLDSLVVTIETNGTARLKFDDGGMKELMRLQVHSVIVKLEEQIVLYLSKTKSLIFIQIHYLGYMTSLSLSMIQLPRLIFGIQHMMIIQ